MQASDAYIMDDPREGQRLAGKVDAADWIRAHFHHYLESARTVLDVGCGSLAIAAEIRRRYPMATVIGVDLSAERVAEGLRRSRARERLYGSVASASRLPYLSDSIDFVYSRFLLEYLPDRANAVREMCRVCRPGGHVLLQDLDGQLVWHFPMEETLRHDVETVVAALARTGFDPFTGRKLFSLAQQAGLCDLSVHVAPYHLYAGAIDAANLAHWDLKLTIALPWLAAALGSDTRANELRYRFLQHLSRTDTLTYSVMFTVAGRKA